MTIERDDRLARLRHGQATVIQLAVPDLRERGATATARDGALLGERVLSQRVQVELPEGAFDEERVFGAARRVWEPDELGIEGLLKADGARRLDLEAADGSFHSVTFLHGGRVLQVTSFEALPDEPLEVEEELEEDPRRVALDVEERMFGPDYGFEFASGTAEGA